MFNSYDWNTLQVVGCDGLVGNNGIAFRTPALRNNKGTTFLPLLLDSERATIHYLFGENEFEELIENDVWVSLNNLSAKRNYIIILRGKQFNDISKSLEIHDKFNWVECNDRFDMTYVSYPNALEWKETCAKTLLSLGIERILRVFKNNQSNNIENAYEILDSAMFMCSHGSKNRYKLIVLYGVLSRLENGCLNWLNMVAISENINLEELFQNINEMYHKLSSSSVSQ